jgi:hypothetical protein
MSEAGADSMAADVEWGEHVTDTEYAQADYPTEQS